MKIHLKKQDIFKIIEWAHKLEIFFQATNICFGVL